MQKAGRGASLLLCRWWIYLERLFAAGAAVRCGVRRCDAYLKNPFGAVHIYVNRRRNRPARLPFAFRGYLLIVAKEKRQFYFGVANQD
jgi:hypothetical protein